MIGVLIVAAAIASAAGNVLIWRDTWRWQLPGGAKPVVASWAEWAALMGVGAAAAWQAGQMPAAVYGAACAAGCALVVPLALRIPAAERDAPARVGQARLDVLLLPAALAGLMLLVTPLTGVGHEWMRTPGPAVAVSVATDALAYLPTAMHAWQQPRDEPPAVYGLFGAGAAASLAAVALQGQMLNLTAVAYPAYLAVADLGVAALILARRRRAAPAAVPYGEVTRQAVLGILLATWRPHHGGGWVVPDGDGWPRPVPAPEVHH